MSIAEKLIEFTKSLDEADNSRKNPVEGMTMADKMQMGMGAMGTLYGSAAEQQGMPTQDWMKQNIAAGDMDMAGRNMAGAMNNTTPEQMQVFQGIEGIPSQMMQPVNQPQAPQLSQTQQNVVAGENSMNRMQQEVDYAKSQQAAQAKQQAAQQQQQNAGITSLSNEDVAIAQGEAKGLVKQAVADQADDIDDTAQAAKETQGWSEEHFRGAIKVIDSLIQQTNPESAEYASLQNRKADLIRVYESQKGSDDPRKAMANQVAGNQRIAQAKLDGEQIQQLARTQQQAVAQGQDVYAEELEEQDTLNQLSDWDMETKMQDAQAQFGELDQEYAQTEQDKQIGADERAAYLEEMSGTGDAQQMAYQPAEKSAQPAPTSRERINMTLDNVNDLQGGEQLVDRIAREQAAIDEADAVRQSIVDTAMDEPTFPDTDKGDSDRLAYQAQDAGFDNVHDYLADTETTPGANVGAGWKDKTADNQMKAIEHQFSKLDKEVASRITEAVQTPPPPGDETGVASVNNMKKTVTESVLNEAGSIKSSADLRGVSAKIFKEAMALENMKNADRDWGPAMMQFGLTLMSTPGNLLTGIGIAGKDALKMWQDIKKGDKTAATAKKELALKYAELADTKDKEEDTAKEKLYTKWDANEDGTVSTSQVTGKKTGKERASQILNEMAGITTKGDLEKLTPTQAAQFSNDYISAYNGSSTTDSFGNVTNLTGKTHPLKVLATLRKKYPNNKELGAIETALRDNRPLNKVQGELKARKHSVNSLMVAYKDLKDIVNKAPANSTNWAGNLASKIDSLLDPVWGSKVGTNKGAIDSAFEETFDSSFDETVRNNVAVKSLIKTLARHRLMARFGEKGRSISNEDMKQEIQNISSMTEWGGSKQKVIEGIDTAMKADLRAYGSEWESAFGNTNGFTDRFTDGNGEIAANLAYGVTTTRGPRKNTHPFQSNSGGAYDEASFTRHIKGKFNDFIQSKVANPSARLKQYIESSFPEKDWGKLMKITADAFD